jgi:hypothetical protein
MSVQKLIKGGRIEGRGDKGQTANTHPLITATPSRHTWDGKKV